MLLKPFLHQLVSWAASRKRKMQALLQQQGIVMQQGVEGSAEIIHYYITEISAGKKQLVQLWIKLQTIDGSYRYTHTHAWLPKNNALYNGAVHTIRYMPQQLSVIIIINK